MVLKSIPSLDSQSGVTLLELLVAVSLSALVMGMAFNLWGSVGRIVFKSQSRQQADFDFRVLLNGIAHNIMAGQGIVRIGEGELALRNLQGTEVEYRYQDSALTVNTAHGVSRNARLTEFTVDATGPIPMNREAWIENTPADPLLDSLDGNRDGLIDFDELDSDRSGTLDGRECLMIGMVRITLTLERDGSVETHSLDLHPRNHGYPDLNSTSTLENAGFSF